MDEIKKSSRPQKKKREAIKYSEAKLGTMAPKIKIKKLGKLLKKKFSYLYVKHKKEMEIYALYLRKQMSIKLDLGIIQLPVKIRKDFSLAQYEHLIETPNFLPQILRFLMIYPFSAPTISNIFNIKLNPFDFFIKRKKLLLYFLHFIQKLKNSEKKMSLRNRKRKQVIKIISKIIKKNILSYSKKYNIANEKHKILLGRNNKFIKKAFLYKKKKVSWRHRKILNVKLLNSVIKKLKKVELKRYLNKNKQNKILIKLLFLLNNAKQNKIISKEKSVKKNYKTTFNNNPLDFFYKKHIKEIEEYCFK